MKGKTCLVTGASSGIGLVVARELAARGAEVVIVCRNREKGESARKEILARAGGASVVPLSCDLSSQRQIRALASEFNRRFQKLHLLVNNAGVVPRTRTLTEDGLETQFAVNHLAYFLLTNLLLDGLKAGAPSRIVNVGSGMSRTATLDFDNLQGEKDYRPMKMYAVTKLLNLHFTFELARRLEGSGVTANCLGPGFTATDLGRDFRPFSRWVMKTFAQNIEKGVDTAVYLAASPEVEGITGRYFERRKEVPAPPSALDKGLNRRVWETSEKLTAAR